MTAEELVAVLVALVVVSARRMGAGLTDRVVQGLEQSVADRLGGCTGGSLVSCPARRLRP